MEKKNKRMKIIVVMVLIICLVLSYFAMNSFNDLIKNTEQLKEWLVSLGWFGKAILALLMSAQVIFVFLPGEPIEFGAGVIYGSIEGLVICLIGAALGSYIILKLVNKFGFKLVNAIFNENKMNKVSQFMHRSDTLLYLFVSFMLPGTPKDLFVYFAGLTSIKIKDFIIVTTVARIPSVLSSTIAGEFASNNNLLMVVAVYMISFGLSGIGYLIYKAYNDKKKEGNTNESKRTYRDLQL